MEQFTKFFGIDVSKDYIDVSAPDGKHYQFSNDRQGYQELSLLLDPSSQCVMEATGSYHHQLASWLFLHGHCVSVVNPLVIKRFAQMRLRIAKTDKADSKIIRLYAELEKPQAWSPPKEYVEQAFELNGLVSLLIRQRTALKNKAHSLSSKGGKKFETLNKSIGKLIKGIDEQIAQHEASMEELVRANQNMMFDNLCSIPRIGKKTALFLIVITNGFEGFESSKQLSSYLGLAVSSPENRTVLD